MITHNDLRKKFSRFWKSRKHKPLETAPLIPVNDPTTLFTSAGMQQLIPNLLGEPHPQGKRLFDVQPCIRTSDIDSVGDANHNTFFEMMGNWSLGDYFKDEQIEWYFLFLTKELGFYKDRLYITLFKGDGKVPKDDESASIWEKIGIAKNRIYFYGPKDNWWSRSGGPDKMPPGEIGGPSSEVFYDFGINHKKEFGAKCHPNCKCGRFMEIGNSVFLQYKKTESGSLKELTQKNVDFGGGLERTLAALNDNGDVFETDLFKYIVKEIEGGLGKKYSERRYKRPIRIIADHLKASTFLIIEGVRPSKEKQGYVLRRLIRRVAVIYHQLEAGLTPDLDAICNRGILRTYEGINNINRSKQKDLVKSVIGLELNKFAESLNRGLKWFNRLKDNQITGLSAFNLYQNYGFPYEITEELALKKGIPLNRKQFESALKSHRILSKKASSGMFRGGLENKSAKTTSYHTATHLLHQALRDVLGDEIKQEGSNITDERLRFDFSFPRKPNQQELVEIENIINEKIEMGLPVYFEILDKKKAETMGALSYFKEKYGEKVKVYSIGGKGGQSGSPYSREFCGGPHVKNTKELGPFKILKVKKIGANLVRIYAQ